MKKPLLIYEPHCEQMPHLVFLLHLADISCTHARTAAEAINWLSAHRNHPFNLKRDDYDRPGRS